MPDPLGRIPQTIGTPLTSGDQLLFLYDARTSRIPYLAITNPATEIVRVEIAFYPPGLERRLTDLVVELAPEGDVVVDPTALASGVVIGSAGLAVVTPVTSATDRRPVVPPRPLVGRFTLANVALGAAFGENALGRLAVEGGGLHAAPGRSVDGNDVVYQRIAPRRLLIPSYFDPTRLSPPEVDGNRILIASFVDRYGDRFRVVPQTVVLDVRLSEADGRAVALPTVARARSVSGVLFTDLQELSGDSGLSTAGSASLAGDPGRGNLLGIFSQALGTYASGQRLPGDIDPGPP